MATASCSSRVADEPRAAGLTFLPIDPWHPGTASLRASATAEGYRFLERLADEWRRGDNRFDSPGERWLGAFRDPTLLVAVGGLGRDPYSMAIVGRLRHLYVAPRHRRTGVGRALVAELLRGPHGHRGVRLRTDDDGAAAFYERLCFERVDDRTATHVWTRR